MKHGYFKKVAVHVPGKGMGTAPVRFWYSKKCTEYGKKYWVLLIFKLIYGYVSGTPLARHGYVSGMAGSICYFVKLK